MTLSDRLREAETAYHRLMTGTAVVEVRDSDGSLIRYTSANAGRLAAYIQSLKDQISSVAPSGPMRVIFP